MPRALNGGDTGGGVPRTLKGGETIPIVPRALTAGETALPTSRFGALRVTAGGRADSVAGIAVNVRPSDQRAPMQRIIASSL